MIRSGATMTDGGKTPISGGRGMAIILLTMLAIMGLIWLAATMLAPK